MQGSLFGSVEPAFDASLTGLERIVLDEWSWIDHLPGWLAGADVVFEHLRDVVPWVQRRVVMYHRMLDEPRLSWWRSADQPDVDPLPVLGEARTVLADHYGRSLDSVGLNYYRDGSDSVAWHGDRNRFWSDDPVIAIVSTGAPRPFLVRPRAGLHGHGHGPAGPLGRNGARPRTRRFELGHGDLLVMGGACQDRWEHGVPKVAHAGPRISVTFRHGQDPDGFPVGGAAATRATIGS